MNLREHILIQPDAISAVDLALLREHVAQAARKDSLVSHFASEDADEVQWVIDRNIRDTQEVELPDAILARLLDIQAQHIRDFINPFYGIEIRDAEPLQLLHYGAGGHYIPHVDAESLLTDDNDIEIWEKTLDRDLSVIWFLNDDFDGGELVFPELDLDLKPAAGTLLCFPADHHYIHGVKPVTRGRRYTLVTWMRVRGMPDMETINRLTMDDYHRCWPEQFEQVLRLRKGGIAQ